MRADKIKAAGVGTEATFENITQQANHTSSCNAETAAEDAKILKSRSTKTETQLRKLVLHLRKGSAHTYQLRREGIAHPAGRVNDLEDAGYLIGVEKVDAQDSDGYWHTRVARYTLLREPQKQNNLPGVSNE